MHKNTPWCVVDLHGYENCVAQRGWGTRITYFDGRSPTLVFYDDADLSKRAPDFSGKMNDSTVHC